MVAKHKTRFFRRLFWLFATPTLILLLGVGGVEAADGMRGNNCVVEKEDVINHDFYFICKNLIIRGTVNGDLLGFASKVTIVRGSTVTGDLWVSSGQLVVEGEVGDDVHFTGGKLEVTKYATFPDPRIDVAALAVSVNVDAGATVPGDILVLGYQGIIDGDVGSNIDFQGQTLRINGKVGGNIDAIVGDRRAESPLRTFPFLPYDIDLSSPGFTIGGEARIEGNLNYEAPQQVILQRDNVQGEVSYRQSLRQADITRVEQTDTFWGIIQEYTVSVMQSTVSLILVGLFFLQFLPALMIEPGKRIQRAYVPAISWGFMLFILSFPFAFMLVLLSIVIILVVTLVTLSSLTVAAILFFIVVNVVIIGGFWFLLVLAGPATTCFILGVNLIRVGHGYFTRRKRNPDDPPAYLPIMSNRYRWMALVVGVIAYSLVVNIPVPAFKTFLGGAVAFVGLGAIFMYARDIWHVTRGGWVMADITSERFDVVPLDSDKPLGWDNLPSGFSGFDE